MYAVVVEDEVVLTDARSEAEQLSEKHSTSIEKVDVWVEGSGFVATEDEDPTVVQESGE